MFREQRHCLSQGLEHAVGFCRSLAHVTQVAHHIEHCLSVVFAHLGIEVNGSGANKLVQIGYIIGDFVEQIMLILIRPLGNPGGERTFDGFGVNFEGAKDLGTRQIADFLFKSLELDNLSIEGRERRIGVYDFLPFLSILLFPRMERLFDVIHPKVRV